MRVLVRVKGICAVEESNISPILVYNPTHPDAGENGYVARPSFSVVEEMGAMLKAQRTYEIIMKNKPFESLDQLVGNRLDKYFKKYSFFKKHFELKSYLGR